MKISFITFKFSKKIFFIITFILIIFFEILIKNFQVSLTSEKNFNNTIVTASTSSSTSTQKKQTTEEKIEQPRILQEKLKGFEIIGKIEIPKLNIEKYILNENSTKALKASVTKICGPQINEIGNFCIAGHNYLSVFGKIKTLQRNDKIILTDVYGNSTFYKIYNIYSCSPKDVSCLDQNTSGDKEITLITCTSGAVKRVIVKAVEIYNFQK